jgi:hypothetical protein
LGKIGRFFSQNVWSHCLLATLTLFPPFLSTADFRNAFLKTIRQIIRESVRNMSLPGPEAFRKMETATPPNAARSGSIDMQLQKPKIPGMKSGTFGAFVLCHEV